MSRLSFPLTKLELKKPDGRALTLYGRKPIAGDIVATSPRPDAVANRSHLRWHPLREEWIAYATHRQDRTFLPPKEYNPLAPTRSKEFPTELPAGDYDVAVFDNLFASLGPDVAPAPESIVPTRDADGRCEVIVFTQDPDTSLSALPLDRVHLLLQVWADRYRALAADERIKYVLPFENKGVEVGVTLHHPHGQIYAYPVVPPVPARMLEAQRNHWRAHAGRGLMGDLMAAEIRDGRRLVHRGEHSMAWIPACARYPYEVWIAPMRACEGPGDLGDDERLDLARTLKTVLMKYDGLWGRSFPYLMAMYAAPTDGEPHPEWHFHLEFYPPYRSRDRLKFLAGTELAAGLFVNDSLPEEKAAELRGVEVRVE